MSPSFLKKSPNLGGYRGLIKSISAVSKYENKRYRVMKSINNQRNGFRYGAYSLEILREYATLSYNGGTYKIVMVKTDEDQKYIAIKQYNEVGEFLRQLLIEPEIAGRIGNELCAVYMRSEQT